jgi:uncharacterized RDD family membrane protein YckC
MKTVNIPTYLNIDLTFEMADAGRRAGAYLIDWVVKGVYIFLLSSILISFNIENDIILFFLFSPFIFYSFLLEWLNKGQTVGKMLLGIRVVGLTGSFPSVSQCAIRWMFLLVDAYLFALLAFMNSWFWVVFIFSPFIGFIFMQLNKYQQRLGDMAAQTYLVKAVEKEYTIYDTIYAYSTISTLQNNDYVAQYPEVIRLSDNDMTIVKSLLEKSKENTDYLLASKLTAHIKKILNIESRENEYVFLRKLLEDYNYLSLKDK